MRHAQDPLGTPGRDVGDGVGDVRRALDDVVVAVALLVLVPLLFFTGRYAARIARKTADDDARVSQLPTPRTLKLATLQAL